MIAPRDLISCLFKPTNFAYCCRPQASVLAKIQSTQGVGSVNRSGAPSFAVEIYEFVASEMENPIGTLDRNPAHRIRTYVRREIGGDKGETGILGTCASES
jgi:hypothetical protein